MHQTRINRTPALLLLVPFLAAALALGGCDDSMMSMDSAAAGTPGGLAPDWETETSYSPTGTTLVPDPSGFGFAVVDEMCGARDDAGFVDRFRTPMYRGIAVHEGMAYLVDGTNLWRVDVSDPAAPVRLDVQALKGHPIAVHYTPQRLWVATIDAGLRGYALDADGAIDRDDVQSILRLGDRRVLDVKGVDGLLYVALGADGVAAVALNDDGRAGATTLIAAGPFANAISVNESRVMVASCDRVQVVERDDGRLGAAPEHRLVADFAVPFGAAKHAAGMGNEVYISAGPALQVFRLDGFELSPRYLGYYRDPKPGFYVNEATAGQGHLYIAAGDQSVRAVSFGDLTQEEGVPVDWDEPAEGELDLPEELDMTTTVVQQQVVFRDPIGIELVGTTVYSLGNFRYLGERTIEIFDVSVPAYLLPAGRYVQPNVGTAISKMGGAVVVHGTDGTHRVVETPASGIPFQQTTFAHEPGLNGTLSDGDDLYMYGPGSMVRARRDGTVVTLDELAPDTVDATSFAISDAHGYVSDASTDGILVIDLDSAEVVNTVTTRDGFLGEAELWVQGGQLLAYDRVIGELRAYDASSSLAVELGRANVGECEAYQLDDFYSGAKNARARFLTATGDDLALLCPRQADGTAALVEIAVTPDGAPRVTGRTALPGEVFTDAILSADAVLIASFDNNSYRSTVTRVERATGRVANATSFMGRANALLVDRDRTYVVDGDFGLRVLDEKLAATTDAPLAF